MTHPLSRRIADVTDLDPAANSIQYEGNWLTWGEVGGYARQIASLAARHGGEGIIPGWASCCATGPRMSRPCSASC